MFSSPSISSSSAAAPSPTPTPQHSRPSSGKNSIMSDLLLFPSSRAANSFSSRRRLPSPSFIRSSFAATSPAPSPPLSEALSAAVSKFSPVAAPSPGGGGSGQFSRLTSKGASPSAFDYSIMSVGEQVDLKLLKSVQRGAEGTGGPRPNSSDRYKTEVTNEKMAAVEAAKQMHRPSSAAASSKFSSSPSPSPSAAAAAAPALGCWLKDFENERKQFRSLFLHGEHVLMQLFGDSEYSCSIPPAQRQKIRTVVACSLIDSFISGSDRFGPLMELVKSQIFNAVFYATEQSHIEGAVNDIQSLLLHSSLGMQQKANIMQKMVEKSGKGSHGVANIRTHQEISDESQRKINVLSHDRDVLIERCSKLERDLADAMNNDSLIRSQLQLLELTREENRRERIQVDSDIHTMKANFEAQKLLMEEQQVSLSSKMSNLQEQVTELQKMLDRSVPLATFSAVVDGCSKWIALAQSSSSYGKSLCQFVEYLKCEGERVRPPLSLKSAVSSSISSSSSSSKPKSLLSEWSSSLVDDASGILPPFSQDVTADIATLIRTLMANKIIHLKVVDDAVASLRLSSTPVTSKQITQLLQTCLRELLGQEHNDAYAHSVASAVAVAMAPSPSPQHGEAVGFLANIIHACIQRGRISNVSSTAQAQTVISAVFSKPVDAASAGGHLGGFLQFAALASDIETQCNVWSQLLLKLQQKNAGDIKDALSDNLISVQLMQSRLAKLMTSACADCSAVQSAVAAAQVRLLKGAHVITCTPFIHAA